MLEERELAASPAWFPLRPCNNGLTLIRLSEADYQSASFLDERLLGRGLPQTDCPFAPLERAAATLTQRPHYIFHIGHVGSTLVSRLVGAAPAFFSLREPHLLRRFAERSPAPPERASRSPEPGLETWLALWARTWRPAQQAVVKATSFVSEIAPAVLATAGAPRAVFMFVSPLAYLLTILGGPNSRLEAQALAPSRFQRLARRVAGDLPQPRSAGEAVAMNWLSEISALHQTALAFPSQVHWLNFDDFLRDPASHLHATFRALGDAAPPTQIDALLGGPLMRQYSKAPEHAYDAALRRAVMAAAEQEHALEIARGLRWLQSVAARHPLGQSVLDRYS
ncbi:MAG: hypothetical protein NVSMB10_17890 [Steroidobacteraceae bacterium]